MDAKQYRHIERYTLRHVHIVRYLHADGECDGFDDIDLDRHVLFHSYFNTQLDSDGHFHRYVIFHPIGHSDFDLDENGYGHYDGNRFRYTYGHFDECSFQLSGGYLIGALSQPCDLPGLLGQVRLAVDLPEDVALDHFHERQPTRGLGDSGCLRKGYFGLGPTRLAGEISGERTLLLPHYRGRASRPMGQDPYFALSCIERLGNSE